LSWEKEAAGDRKFSLVKKERIPVPDASDERGKKKRRPFEGRGRVGGV